MNRFGLFLFLALILYFIFLIRQDIIDNIGLKHDTARLSQRIVAEKERAGQLKQRLNNLQDNEYLEQLARTRLQLVKKGETAYKVFGGEKVNAH